MDDPYAYENQVEAGPSSITYQPSPAHDLTQPFASGSGSEEYGYAGSSSQPTAYTTYDDHDLTQSQSSSQIAVTPYSDQTPSERPLTGPGSRGGKLRGNGRPRGRGGGESGLRRGLARGPRGGSRASTRISKREPTHGQGSQGKSKPSSTVPSIKITLKAGSKPSFLGDYYREIDEDDEPLAFEEQFILRVPKDIAEGKAGSGEGGLREMVKGKGKGLEGIEFKFLDSRRAAFKFHNTLYPARLVDLPCIIESQKTYDKSHLFKIADISQMLIVEDNPLPTVTEEAEAQITANPLKIDEYIYPHGLTPPLRHVRKRRFRKRLSRRAIEVVEEQVEELLSKDEDAEASHYDLIDMHPDPEIADSYYIDYDPEAMWQNSYNEDGYGSEYGGSEMYGDPGSVAPSQMEDWGEGGEEYGTEYDDEGGEEGEDGEGDEGEGTLDQELAAALMGELEGSDEPGSGESEDEDDNVSGSDDEEDDGAKSEDDEETLEKRAKIKQFTNEIKALESAVEKKRAGFVGGNPILMKRFEETIAGLQADIQAKISSRQTLVDELGKADADADGEEEDNDAQGDGDGEGDMATPTGGRDDIPRNSTDVDMGTPMDDEGDYDEGEGATPAAEGEGEGTQYSDEDLFGEDDDEVEGEEEEEDEEEEEEEEDEMARMLRAELDGLASISADQGNVIAEDRTMDIDGLDELPGTPTTAAIAAVAAEAAVVEEQDAAAAAALNDFALAEQHQVEVGDGEYPSLQLGAEDQEQGEYNELAALGMGLGMGGGFIEGGAGRRRLISGAEGDASSDEDSDESDD